MATRMHAGMLSVHGHGRTSLQAPLLRQLVCRSRCSMLQTRTITICAARKEVCKPDQLSKLAGAVATAALLLPAALPADVPAAIAEAGQAPPPQRWFTLAVLLGAGGLAAAQQIIFTSKTAQVVKPPAEAVTAAKPEPKPLAAAAAEPAAAAKPAVQQAAAAAEPVAEPATAVQPTVLAATSAIVPDDGMAATSAEPAATTAPAAMPVAEPMTTEAPAPPEPIVAAPPPLPHTSAAAEPVLAASTDILPAALVNKEKSSSTLVTGRSLASGSSPQGLQLAASAMPVAPASKAQQTTPTEPRKTIKEEAFAATPILQQDAGKAHAVAAFLTAPLHWSVRLVMAIWAWIQSLSGRSHPAAA